MKDAIDHDASAFRKRALPEQCLVETPLPSSLENQLVRVSPGPYGDDILFAPVDSAALRNKTTASTNRKRHHHMVES